MIDNKNYIFAIVFSIAILIGWQYFFVQPQIEQQQQAIESQPALSEDSSNVPQPSSTTDSGDSIEFSQSSSPTVTTANNRETVIQSTNRVEIDTPRISGSINLTGARIDDIRLRGYHETYELSSPNIVLFSPQGTRSSYYSQHGWSTRADTGVTAPTDRTVWNRNGSGPLTPNQPLSLSWDNGEGLIFKRKIAIDENYMFTITQSVENNSTKTIEMFPYGLISRMGEPETSGFFILHEGLISFLGEAGLSEIDYSDLVDEQEHRIRGNATDSGWLGITDKYWTATLIPPSGRRFQPEFKYIESNDIYQANFIARQPVQIAPGSVGNFESLLYAGAKINSLLQTYSENYEIERFDLLIDWGWFYFITKPMFHMIDWFYNLVGNFGIAILLATVVIKIVFFPLANKSYVSMSRMKLVQPQMTKIREQFKNDKQGQQKALMELYKKEKINPLAGCLPIAIQIPVFFALYKVLFVTIEMRHAPFFGWIRDLSAADPTSIFNLFGLIPWDPPQLLVVGVWPLLMGFTMFIQMKMNPTPTEPAQQLVFNWLPVIFTFMLASFPAGLVIYWVWNNLLSILQQYVIMRRQGVKIELWDNLKGMIKPKPKSEAG